MGFNLERSLLGASLDEMLDKIFKRKRNPETPFSGVNRQLETIGSGIRLTDRKVSLRNRTCTVFGNYIDFWENGMKWLGIDQVTEDRDKAILLHLWLELGLNSKEIESRVPGIQFPISRKKIEEGEASFLDWYWQNLQARGDRRFGRLIELFASNDRTRRLMSFTRLRDFAFSNRIPPGMIDSMLPYVRITDSFDFEVVVTFGIVDEDGERQPRRVVGTGTAEQVFELVLKYLPNNLGMARYIDEEAEDSAA